MRRKISEYVADRNMGTAVVSYNSKDELFEIDYYDNVGHHFFMEEFSNSTLKAVEAAAEDWALGHRQLEKVA